MNRMRLFRLLLGLLLPMSALRPASAAAPDADTRLLGAAHAGDLEIARAALRKGADPNAETRGYRAINLAAERGHFDVVKLLLEHRADPNQRNSGDHGIQTALEAAVGAKDRAVVEALLKAGASPNVPRTAARTAPPQGKQPSLALARAVRGDQRDIARLLLQAGASATQEENDSQPILHMLAARGWKEEVELALRNGADLNGRDSEHGWTPILAASRGGSKETVELLISKGATFETSDDTRGLEAAVAATRGH